MPVSLCRRESGKRTNRENQTFLIRFDSIGLPFGNLPAILFAPISKSVMSKTRTWLGQVVAVHSDFVILRRWHNTRRKCINNLYMICINRLSRRCGEQAVSTEPLVLHLLLQAVEVHGESRVA